MIAIITAHIDCSKPVVWVNTAVSENDAGMRVLPCVLVADSLTSSTMGTHGVILDASVSEKKVQEFKEVDSFGWFYDRGCGMNHRTVFNFIDLSNIDTEKVDGLGKF